MNSNLLPGVDSLPDGFVDGATAGDVSIKKTEKRRTFPVPLCEEETDGNEDGDLNDLLSSKLSLDLEQKESSSQTCEGEIVKKLKISLRYLFVIVTLTLRLCFSWV